jgi:hypothetical protein
MVIPLHYHKYLKNDESKKGAFTGGACTCTNSEEAGFIGKHRSSSKNVKI